MATAIRFQVRWLGLLLLALAGWPATAQVAAPDWQTVVASSGAVTVQASTLSADGASLYLVGGFSGTANFGSTRLSTTNDQEAFIAKWSLATGNFVWAVQGVSTGSSSSRNHATGVAVVSTTSVYVAGNFSSATLKLGSATALANAQPGTSDVWLTRLYDAGSSATISLANRAGGLADDYANAVAYYGSTVYVGGANGGNAIFGTYPVASAGGYVVGFYANGAPVAAPLPMGRSVNALASVSGGGGLYAAGGFNNASNAFGDASHTLTSAGDNDVFVARFNGTAALTYAWAQRAGGTGADNAGALLATAGSVYVGGGSYSPTADFGATTLSPGGGAAFVAKLADGGTAGTFTWAVQSGGSPSVFNGVSALAQYGSSVYVAGSFGGSPTFGGSPLTSVGNSADVLLAKLADNGSSAAFVWGQAAGGSGGDYSRGLTRVGSTLYLSGTVTTPASFGALSVGSAQGPQTGFVATLTDPAPLLTLAAPNIGAVGTPLTLYGTNLGGTTAITFAGSSNNVVTSGFTVNAAGTQITGVTVPAGAQSGPLNVTSGRGSSNGLVRFQVLPGANPAPAWQAAAVATSGAGNFSIVQRAQADSQGNVVVAGYFTGTLTLGSTTLNSTGAADVFVAKYSPATASYVWARSGGSSGYEYVYGLAVQGTSIYVAGMFAGQSATFGGVVLNSTAGDAGFVVKYTDAGSSASPTWGLLLDDGSTVYLESLAVSGSSVYVAGDYTGAALNVGSGVLTGQDSGDDGFVARLTDNGSTVAFNWAKRMGSASGSLNVYGLGVRGSTVYLGGNLSGTVSFGPYQLASTGYSDVAVVRLTDLGTTADFTAALRMDGLITDGLTDLLVQGTNIYLAGYSDSPTLNGLANAGRFDAFVMKVVDAGATLGLAWTQLLGGAGYDEARQLAVNGSNVYVAGSFTGPATFGGTTLLGAGGSDAFVARLRDATTSATVSWVQAAGGLGTDNGSALALTPGTVWVGGFIAPDASFGPLAYTGRLGTLAYLSSLNDPAVLGTAPAVAGAGRLYAYPNPAHDQATVQLPAGARVPLCLLDALGRAVRTYPALAAGATEATLDLRGLPAGLYLLQAGPGAGLKLVVE